MCARASAHRRRGPRVAWPIRGQSGGGFGRKEGLNQVDINGKPKSNPVTPRGEFSDYTLITLETASDSVGRAAVSNLCICITDSPPFLH